MTEPAAPQPQCGTSHRAPSPGTSSSGLCLRPAPLGAGAHKLFLEVAPCVIMGFLNEILGRPANGRPYLILVTGYPAHGARVPVAGGRKKALAEIATFV